MRLQTITHFREQRDIAMSRARWCKQAGLLGYSCDVCIARRFNRMLLRAAR